MVTNQLLKEIFDRLDTDNLCKRDRSLRQDEIVADKRKGKANFGSLNPFVLQKSNIHHTPKGSSPYILLWSRFTAAVPSSVEQVQQTRLHHLNFSTTEVHFPIADYGVRPVYSSRQYLSLEKWFFFLNLFWTVRDGDSILVFDEPLKQMTVYIHDIFTGCLFSIYRKIFKIFRFVLNCLRAFSVCHHFNCNTRSRCTRYTTHDGFYNILRPQNTFEMFKYVYLIVCVLCLFYVLAAVYMLFTDFILDPLYGYLFDREGTAAGQTSS
ncbi:hypothetical protein QTP88_003572 [Uroleucon formosanum]